MKEETKERLQKLLTFVCALAGVVDFTRIAFRFTHDLILGLIIGGAAGSVFGGFAAGLISVALGEPVLFVYVIVAVAIVIVLRAVFGGTWIGLLFAW